MELIDRRPLIEKLKNAIALGHKIETFVGELEAVLEGVENMPTIEAPKWIPCSERLPSWDDCGCLVNVIAEDHTYSIILAPTYMVEDMYRNGWINAWMPLSNPYEETDHE